MSKGKKVAAAAAETASAMEASAEATEAAGREPVIGSPEREVGKPGGVVGDDFQVPIPEAGEDLPPWVELPGDLIIPRGAQVGFLRIRSNLTADPSQGDRQCVVWPLTDLDERLAMSRIQDNPYNAIAELTVQMIRAIDGAKVNWAAKRGDPGNIKDFWRDLGPKGRSLVQRYYTRTHQVTAEETMDFLSECVAVRTMT